MVDQVAFPQLLSVKSRLAIISKCYDRQISRQDVELYVVPAVNQVIACREGTDTERQAAIEALALELLDSSHVNPHLTSLLCADAKRALGDVVLCELRPSLQPPSQDGSMLTVKAKPTTKVGKLRQLVQDIKGIPCDEQKLLYDGEALEDDHALGYYDIETGDTVHVILKMSGC